MPPRMMPQGWLPRLGVDVPALPDLRQLHRCWLIRVHPPPQQTRVQLWDSRHLKIFPGGGKSSRRIFSTSSLLASSLAQSSEGRGSSMSESSFLTKARLTKDCWRRILAPLSSNLLRSGGYSSPIKEDRILTLRTPLVPWVLPASYIYE